MVTRVGKAITILGLTLILLSLYACVPAIKGVKSENTSNKDHESNSLKKNANPDKKGGSPDTKKDAIREAWLAGQQMPTEKDKTSNTKNGQSEPSNKSGPKEITGPETKPNQSLSDEDRVKKAALQVIKELASPQKYLICHDEIKDEWSLTVFDDIGHILDVKQYYWNMETEKMEPFLVLNRIPKSHLNDELSKKSLGKNCKTYRP